MQLLLLASSASMKTTTAPEEVLDFWFGPPPHSSREAWFRKDPAFDAAVRDRFGEAVEAALAGGLVGWSATPLGTLARVLLLDQFPRNVHRDTPLAFAGDALALCAAKDAIDRGFDRQLDFFERWFLYLPFEHSEDWGMQERSLELFGQLAAETGNRGPLEWAEKHAAVVRRFGRYPHRNAILGRRSTPEELAFLAEPGSSF
jgi:uncharacterized protein (DUF924 family)